MADIKVNARTVVALETSAAFGSVAVVTDEGLRLETCVSVPQGHCESLLPMLQGLLTETGTELPSVHAFAVSLGPGSFTALRIGLSTAKALSMSTGKPLVGVGTLDALSHNVAGLCSHVCPIIDARRREVFYALYRDRTGQQERLTEYCAASPEQAVAHVSRLLGESEGGGALFLGDGVPLCREFIEREIARPVFPASHLGIPRASSVGMLALGLLEQNRVADIETLEPIYVRRSDAELRRRRT
ncbi:MAG: tRNA (adenosine(37)-N6)-threonylcarbamoyltransferase complex dimerization subunit type 1 TsaB [Candidatus Eiseniibacteriota bacterium]|nr:MAG: tRNA (adenosine(37)-N6)-threonylcarbamoyltransferase complex dimerization subunit type 1 TsaB [Candidatus Eisenbacteria bacterium]